MNAVYVLIASQQSGQAVMQVVGCVLWRAEGAHVGNGGCDDVKACCDRLLLECLERRNPLANCTHAYTITIQFASKPRPIRPIGVWRSKQ